MHKTVCKYLRISHPSLFFKLLELSDLHECQNCQVLKIPRRNQAQTSVRHVSKGLESWTLKPPLLICQLKPACILHLAQAHHTNTHTSHRSATCACLEYRRYMPANTSQTSSPGGAETSQSLPYIARRSRPKSRPRHHQQRGLGKIRTRTPLRFKWTTRMDTSSREGEGERANDMEMESAIMISRMMVTTRKGKML